MADIRVGLSGFRQVNASVHAGEAARSPLIPRNPSLVTSATRTGAKDLSIRQARGRRGCTVLLVAAWQPRVADPPSDTHFAPTSPRRHLPVAGLPQKAELAYASRLVNSIELNGSFYSLLSPKAYQGFVDQVRCRAKLKTLLSLSNPHPHPRKRGPCMHACSSSGVHGSPQSPDLPLLCQMTPCGVPPCPCLRTIGCAGAPQPGVCCQGPEVHFPHEAPQGL